MKLKLFALFILLVMLNACDDFLEKDISLVSVQLTSPIKGVNTADSVTTFLWQEVDGATNYHFQLVSPKFEAIQKLLIDTIVDYPHLNYKLAPGHYQWKVNAQNVNYASVYAIDSFVVVPPFQIKNMLVELTSPEDLDVTNNNLVDFTWNKLENVQNYEFVIKKNSWKDSIHYSEQTIKTLLKINLNDGIYFWGVAGVQIVNGIESKSNYSTRVIYVNSKAPAYPKITQPLLNDTIKNEFIQIIWEKVENCKSYNVQLFKSTDMGNALTDEWISDTIYTCYLNQNGAYSCRIRSKDSFNEVGQFSSFINFVVKTDKNLATEKVSLVSPADGSTLKDSLVTFLWNEVEGANKYTIQIFTPNFEQAKKVLTNTVQTKNQFEIVLEPGDYSWRVKAQNDKSETPFRSGKFIVYGSTIATKSVNLLTPGNEKALNQRKVKFTWESLGANYSYCLVIKNADWTNGSTFKKIEIPNTSSEIELDSGIYYWGVQAIDLTNQKRSEFTVRKIDIDISAPNTPLLVSPLSNSESTRGQLDFTWSLSADASTYVIEIYKITNSKLVLYQTATCKQASFQGVFNETGSYEWRVKAQDKAGNESAFSFNSTFKITGVENIADKVVKLLSPTDKSILQGSEVTLWWEDVAGATSYRLQVAKPNFSNPVSALLDITLEDTKYTLPLTTGSFEWQVRAINTLSQTKFTTRSFQVEDNDLSNKIIQLLQPANNALLKTKSVTFTWNKLNKSASYVFQLKANDWTNGTIIEQRNTTDSTLTFELGDGSYYWGVKAVNNLNSSSEYAVRNLKIDTAAPEIPLLVSPVNNYETYEKNIIFSWEDGAKEDEKLEYNIELHKQSGSIDFLVATYHTSLKTFIYKFTDSGNYYWKVQTVDKAGNVSPFSISNLLVIKNYINLANSSVVLLSPKESLRTRLTKITFWWDKLDGANTYVFQLIRPNFTSPEDVVSEVEISENKIVLDLTAKGNYQWRVKAKNSISETGFVIRNLILE